MIFYDLAMGAVRCANVSALTGTMENPLQEQI